MTRSKLLLSTSLCMALSLPAYAAGQKFSDVDSDGNGQLDRSELASVLGSRNADRMLSRSDRNGDGTLSVGEVRSSGDDNEGDDDESDDNENDDGENDDGESSSGGQSGSDDGESDHSESDDGGSDDGESDHGENDDGGSDDGESNGGGHNGGDD